VNVAVVPVKLVIVTPLIVLPSMLPTKFNEVLPTLLLFNMYNLFSALA
jgi:hypothetical protein